MKYFKVISRINLLFWECLFLIVSCQLTAETFEVISSTDMGVGSLREAISIADSGDTIRFSSIIDELPIVLSGHQLFLDKNLTIIGNHS
jgi:hypothetical protein